MLRLSCHREQHGGARRSRSARPRLEILEDRCVPSTLVVDHDWGNNAPANVPAPQGTLE
jgi:hypothetical protein